MDKPGRWSLDHLFVTRSGIPVLVELKRAVDTRLRREVIGQMLDYAANGTTYWQSGRIAESFAASMAEQGRDADAELAMFLADTTEPRLTPTSLPAVSRWFLSRTRFHASSPVLSSSSTSR